MSKPHFSEETQQRMDVLKQILKSYEKNIALLHQAAKGELNLKHKGYTFGAESYQRTPADEHRFAWTLNNLNMQMRLYQHELETLKHYGR